MIGFAAVAFPTCTTASVPGASSEKMRGDECAARIHGASLTDHIRNTTGGENLETSDESSINEIALAKAEGAAYAAALKYLTTAEASDSGQREVGDYIVGYAMEDAEGLYQLRDGHLEWEEPREDNCHLEVAVRNASDGRFLPGLSVQASLRDPAGNLVGNYGLPFLWHPWIYHYGANCRVPAAGRYKLTIHIAVPAFPRHDRTNGCRFQQPVDVEFDVNIKTGRKLSRAA